MKQQSTLGAERRTRRTPQHFPEYLESRNFQDEITQLDTRLQEFREHTASRQALLTNAISAIAYEAFLAGRRAREQAPGFAPVTQPLMSRSPANPQDEERNRLAPNPPTEGGLGSGLPNGFFQTLESIREPVRIDPREPKTCWACITFLIFIAGTLGSGLFILWNSL